MSDSDTSRPRSAKEIFFEALEKYTPQERAAFLDGACGTNPVQRAKVEALLADHFQQDAFMKDPAVEAPPLSSPEPPPPESPAQVLGRYKLLEKIGEGGFGEVWMAEQREPVKRRVALKIIKLGMDSRQVVARFEAERQALAMMDHVNIARIFDADVTGTGRPYFVMELVRGVKITDYCDQNQLTTKERLDLFIKVCQAIQHAHQKGIIHRDIKPSNILVTLHDGVPVPKVIDFGIAKATQSQLTEKTVFTQFQQFIGTPAYISPEQAELSGLDIDTRSDIYSLGVLLYELLVGQTPIDAKEMMKGGLEALRQIIREREPQRPSTRLNTLAGEILTTAAKRRQTEENKLVLQLRGDLDWIVMKCLEKDRRRRYDTANGLAIDIQRHLANEPVMARPPSTAYRIQKAWQRNRRAFTAAAAVVVALLLGTGVSIWQAVVATRAKEAENRQAGLARMERDHALEARSTAVQQRDLAQQRLYDSLVREAHSIRTIRPMGFRRQLIDRIQKALAIPTAKKDMDELRTEVSQCFGDPLSFDPVRLEDPPSSFLDIAVSNDGSVVAHANEKGQLVMHETAGGKVIHRDEVKGQLTQLVFVPDRRSLFGLAREPADNAGRPLRVSLKEWRQAGGGSWSQQPERTMPDLLRLVGTGQGVIALIQDATKDEIRLDDVVTGRTAGSIPLTGRQFSEVCDVTSDLRLAAYSVDNVTDHPESLIEIRDLAANKSLIRLSPEMGIVRNLQFSPDLRLLVCTADYGIVTFETSRFRVVNTYRQLTVARPVWCEDGTRLALPFAQENGIRLCSVLSGTEARLTTEHQVKAVRSSLDGSVLLVVPYAGSTLAVRMTGSRERRHFAGHVGGVPAVEFSPDGNLIASTGKDGLICVRDVQSGKVRHTLAIPRGVQGQTIAFSPDGRWLASGNYQNNEVLVWALNDGRQVLALGDGRQSGGTWSCGFSPDGRVLVAAGDALSGWELSPGTAGARETPLEAREIFHHRSEARNLQFHPGGKWIGFEGRFPRGEQEKPGVFFLGLERGSEPDLIFERRGYAVQSLGMDAAGGYLISISGNRTLKFHDPRTHASIRDLPSLSASEVSSSYISNFRVSPDGTKVAIANHNGRGVNIHHLASARRLYTLPDDAGPIWWLAWHPDGRQLAVARGDGDISIWILPEVEKVLAEVGLAP
jgi:WD40 repeat protein/tRNA A-37 threonylcarbamoyl transferase component Bud32